jgi:hypothetical protein
MAKGFLGLEDSLDTCSTISSSPSLPSALSEGFKQSSRRHKPTRNLNPLGNTTALFALDVHNICVAPAPAPDAIFFLRVPFRPVVVVFFQHFEILAICGGAFLLEISSEVGFTW